LVPKTLTFKQAIFAAEAHLAEEQFLLDSQTFNKEKSIIIIIINALKKQ
jgi:hypothetical protein